MADKEAIKLVNEYMRLIEKRAEIYDRYQDMYIGGKKVEMPESEKKKADEYLRQIKVMEDKLAEEREESSPKPYD